MLHEVIRGVGINAQNLGGLPEDRVAELSLAVDAAGELAALLKEELDTAVAEAADVEARRSELSELDEQQLRRRLNAINAELRSRGLANRGRP